MFDLLEKELECDFAYIESEIANAEYESFDPDFFLEAGENSPESFLDRIIKKIQDIVERVKKAFSELFAKKSVDKVTEKYDAAKEKDPSIANKKVKMKDYKKLQELNDNTMTVLLKTEDGEKKAIRTPMSTVWRNRRISCWCSSSRPRSCTTPTAARNMFMSLMRQSRRIQSPLRRIRGGQNIPRTRRKRLRAVKIRGSFRADFWRAAKRFCPLNIP